MVKKKETIISNLGAWHNKLNFKDFIIINDPNQQPPEGYVKAMPLYDTELEDYVAYQKWNEKSKTWEPDNEAEIVADAEKERKQIIAEIAARDYRAMKAVKLDIPLDELYPGESDWYKSKIARVHELDIVMVSAK